MGAQDELIERRVNISQVRRHGWTADRLQRAMVTMIDLARARELPQGEDGELVQELLVWLDHVGRAAIESLTEELNLRARDLCPVPSRFAALAGYLSGPERGRADRVRAAYPDPVPALIELVRDLTPSELEGYDDLPEPHAAAVLVLGELASEEAARCLVSVRLSAWRNERLCELIQTALGHAGAVLIEPTLEAWEAVRGWTRTELVDLLANAGVRDERLFDRLIEWLGTEHEAALDAIATYGDMRAAPFLHAMLDRSLPAAADDHDARCLVAGLVDALARLGVELTAVQLERLAALPPGEPVVEVGGQTFGAPIASSEPPRPHWESWKGPSPEELTRMAASEDPAVRAKAAGNPNTPRGAKELLVRDPDVEVRRTLARMFGSELSECLEDEDDVVRAYGVYGAPESRLASLARDPSASVRSCIADHPAVTLSILEMLARDKDPEVRASVASGQRTPRRLLHVLSRDPEERVRRVASRAVEGKPRLCDCCGLEHLGDDQRLA